MNTKLTSEEIKQLYAALPTKMSYQKIKDGYNDLEKIYGDFVVNVLGYENVEAALQEGSEIVSDNFRHPDDCYPAELLEEVITNLI